MQSCINSAGGLSSDRFDRFFSGSKVLDLKTKLLKRFSAQQKAVCGESKAPLSHLFMNSTHTAWFIICNAYDTQHSKRLVFCIHSCTLYLSLDVYVTNAQRALIRDTSWFCQKVFSSYFMTLYLNAYEGLLIYIHQTNEMYHTIK